MCQGSITHGEAFDLHAVSMWMVMVMSGVFDRDHHMWLQIGQDLNRSVAASIPSRSTHGEEPFVALGDWGKYMAFN